LDSNYIQKEPGKYSKFKDLPSLVQDKAVIKSAACEDNQQGNDRDGNRKFKLPEKKEKASKTGKGKEDAGE
jgi:hypothetical protein